MRAPIIISLVIATLAGLWVLSAIIVPPPEVKEQSNSVAGTAQAFSVRSEKSAAIPVTDFAIVTGRTEPYRNVDLSAEIDARIEEILVEEGAHVEEGQVLVKLNIADRAARVEEARQSVNQRQIEYNAAKSLKTKGFSSDIRLAETRTALEAAQAALVTAKKELSDTNIKAPFTGIINDRMVDLGDYVSRGNAVMTLVQLDPIEITGFVSERNILGVQEGAEAEAHFLDGQILKGIVTFIAPSANEQTRTFRVKVQVPNPKQTIRGGLTAELKIPLANQMGHRIPASILTLNDAGILGVKYIDDHNLVQFQPVHIIRSEEDSVLISGLPDQVNLITVGSEFVATGQPVDTSDIQREKGE